MEGYYPPLAYRNKEMFSFENRDPYSCVEGNAIYDPQTNGSILSIVSPDSIHSLTNGLSKNGAQLHIIGRIEGDSFQLKEMVSDA